MTGFVSHDEFFETVKDLHPGQMVRWATDRVPHGEASGYGVVVVVWAAMDAPCVDVAIGDGSETIGLVRDFGDTIEVVG